MIFHPSDRNRLNLYVTNQFDRGKTLKVEIVTTSKTLSQNAYCWLVFTHIGQETGNTKEDVYQFCLKQFPVFKEIELNGIIDVIPVTLSKMDKDQVSHFIDEFVTFFRSEGYDVPDPEDSKSVEMYNYYKQKGLI